jgi:hypothetical protein
MILAVARIASSHAGINMTYWLITNPATIHHASWWNPRYIQPIKVDPFLHDITDKYEKFDLLVHVPTLYLNSGQGTPCSGITEVARNDLHIL